MEEEVDIFKLRLCEMGVKFHLIRSATEVQDFWLGLGGVIDRGRGPEAAAKKKKRTHLRFWT